MSSFQNSTNMQVLVQTITIKTEKPKEVVDLTHEVDSFLRLKEVKEGTITITVLHTTCAITTADLDPGTDQDLLDVIEKLVPKGEYRHPHDPGHVGDHIMASIVGPSVTLPVKKGELPLGEWQRIVLIELSGPRERYLTLSYMGE